MKSLNNHTTQTQHGPVLMNPLVTIIIPAYNAELYLAECLNSIFSQTYANTEIIVIDDCSLDGTLEVLRNCELKDNRIRSVVNDRNRGISFCRNLGIKQAKGKYLAWLDSDDVAMPDRIATQVAFLETNLDYGLVSSDLIIIDEASREIGYRDYPHTDHDIRKVLTRYNPFAQPASMLRKEIIDKVGMYNENLECGEDYELFLRVASVSNVANLASSLTKYRISAGQSKSRQLKQTIRNTLKVQHMTRGLRFPDSVQNKLYRVVLKWLLVLPNGLILWLFKKITYSR